MDIIINMTIIDKIIIKIMILIHDYILKIKFNLIKFKEIIYEKIIQNYNYEKIIKNNLVMI